MNNILRRYKASFEGLSVQVWIISALMFINRSGLMVMTYLTIYLTVNKEFTIIQAGKVGACYGVGSLISSLMGGMLSDKFGFKLTMMFSLLVGGVSFWVWMTVEKFIPMCIIAFITALIADLIRPAVMSSISFYSEEANRTRAISLLRMAINLGISIGPALGGFLANKYGYDLLFIVNGGTAIATFVIYFFVQKIMNIEMTENVEKAVAHNSPNSAFYDINYLYLLLLFVMITTPFIQIIFSIPLFFKEIYGLSEIGIGLFFSINGIIIVIFEMPIVQYFESKRLFSTPIVIGGLLMALANFSLLLPYDGSNPLFWIPLGLYTILVGFGEQFNFPFFSSLSLARSNSSNIGSYMGLYTFSFSLSLTISPIIGSFVVAHYGFKTLWLSCALVMLLSSGLFYAQKRMFLVNETYL